VNDNAIRAEVVAILQQEIGPVHLENQSDLAETLDSMQRLSLAVAVEDHFLICLDPEDETAIETLDDLIACVQRKLQRNSAHA